MFSCVCLGGKMCMGVQVFLETEVLIRLHRSWNCDTYNSRCWAPDLAVLFQHWAISPTTTTLYFYFTYIFTLWFIFWFLLFCCVFWYYRFARFNFSQNDHNNISYSMYSYSLTLTFSSLFENRMAFVTNLSYNLR